MDRGAAELLALGDDLPGRPVAEYKRRIGRVAAVAGRAGHRRRRPLLGRPTPTTSTAQHTFRLFPDGTGDGAGPSGARHTRFRTWKEDLIGR